MHLSDRVACSVLQGSFQHDEFDLNFKELRSNSSCWEDPCKTEQATLSNRCAVLQQLAFPAGERVTTSSRQVYIRQQQAMPMQLPCKRISAPCTVTFIVACIWLHRRAFIRRRWVSRRGSQLLSVVKVLVGMLLQCNGVITFRTCGRPQSHSACMAVGAMALGVEGQRHLDNSAVS